MIIKNNSMLEDYHNAITDYTGFYQALQRLHITPPNPSSHFILGAPIGHVYSIIVEELDVTNPNIDLFIQRLSSNHSEMIFQQSKLKRPTDQIKNIEHILSLSHIIVEDGVSWNKSYEKIMSSAIGYKHQGIINSAFFISVEYIQRKQSIHQKIPLDSFQPSTL